MSALGWRTAAAPFVAGIAILSCGAETIELALGDAAIDSAAGDDGGATGILSNDASPRTCDGSAPPPACRALGDRCGSAADCCSTHCAAGVCVIPGTCAGQGSPCSTRGDCCSGLCEFVVGTTTRACLAECRPAGAACTRASDCCALACNAGACGGAECLQEGTDCTSNAQCCSNACDASQGGKCVLDSVALCRPSGEDCTSGGGGPCCGICDDTVKRCDPGPGPCRATGTICEQTSDCCQGSCAPDSTGRRVCTSPLLSDGNSCQAGFECASGSCGGNPPACGQPLAACVPSGTACAAGAQCCSGTCVGGMCQPGCVSATR